MGCRCNERGQHMLAAAKAVARGDLKTVGASVRDIAATIRDDARDFRSKIATAKANLARR